MDNTNRLAVARAHALCVMPVLVALFQPFTCAASDALPSGYAALVRQAAESLPGHGDFIARHCAASV